MHSMIIKHKNQPERYQRYPQYGRQINVEENIWDDLTQVVSDFAWLKRDRREYHPMFIAIKICILIYKYWLQVLRMIFL
jgi:hypothetical protein